MHTNSPYEWPEILMLGIDPDLRVEKNPLKRLHPMRLREDKVEAFMSSGYYLVWPFARSADYRKALACPQFMRGGGKVRDGYPVFIEAPRE